MMENYKAFNDKVNVAKVGVYKGRHGVTLDSLYRKWLVFLEAARRTVQHTTQREVSTILHPSLLKNFNTNV